MDTGEGVGLLTTAFGLNKKQQRLLLQIGWVVIVTTHIAWACGWLAAIGLIGFARADEVQKLQQTLAASARVTLSQEIRSQVRVRCLSSDFTVRDSITRYIDSLQIEYERIAGSRFPEPPCETVRVTQ